MFILSNPTLKKKKVSYTDTNIKRKVSKYFTYTLPNIFPTSNYFHFKEFLQLNLFYTLSNQCISFSVVCPILPELCKLSIFAVSPSWGAAHIHYPLCKELHYFVCSERLLLALTTSSCFWVKNQQLVYFYSPLQYSLPSKLFLPSSEPTQLVFHVKAISHTTLFFMPFSKTSQIPK